MNGIIPTLIGGALSLLGTFMAIWLQFKFQKHEKDRDYKNDLVSMLDIIVYKSSKVRNNELNFKNAVYSKKDTEDIYLDISREYRLFDDLIQELIVMMSHHIEHSNTEIKQILDYYKPLELQFNQFKIAYKIYVLKYDESKKSRNTIVFSKRKLDIEVELFIKSVTKLAREKYQHKIYQPPLHPIVSKDGAINFIETIDI